MLRRFNEYANAHDHGHWLVKRVNNSQTSSHISFHNFQSLGPLSNFQNLKNSTGALHFYGILNI